MNLSIILNLISSTIGLAYFIYGKKSERWNFIICGAILMFWPYFISNLLIELLGDIVLLGVPFFVDF